MVRDRRRAATEGTPPGAATSGERRAATNRPVEEMVRSAGFRRDLLARFAAGRLALPSLRERREDVLAIAEALTATPARPRRPSASRAADSSAGSRRTRADGARTTVGPVDFARAVLAWSHASHRRPRSQGARRASGAASRG